MLHTVHQKQCSPRSYIHLHVPSYQLSTLLKAVLGIGVDEYYPFDTISNSSRRNKSQLTCFHDVSISRQFTTCTGSSIAQESHVSPQDLSVTNCVFFIASLQLQVSQKTTILRQLTFTGIHAGKSSSWLKSGCNSANNTRSY